MWVIRSESPRLRTRSFDFDTKVNAGHYTRARLCVLVGRFSAFSLVRCAHIWISRTGYYNWAIKTWRLINSAHSTPQYTTSHQGSHTQRRNGRQSCTIYSGSYMLFFCMAIYWCLHAQAETGLAASDSLDEKMYYTLERIHSQAAKTEAGVSDLKHGIDLLVLLFPTVFITHKTDIYLLRRRRLGTSLPLLRGRKPLSSPIPLSF